MPGVGDPCRLSAIEWSTPQLGSKVAMNLDWVPIWAFFVGTILLVMGFIEVGYRLGDLAHRKSADEKEAPISGVSGTVLGLTAFIMAFTFAIVADRYQIRKNLVREDANAIRLAYVRADFLPEPDRAESKRLLKAYLDGRLAFASGGDIERDIGPLLAETDRIQRRLWRIAVTNAERDMNSDVAALYIEALNEVSEVNVSRLTVGVRARVPMGIWFALYSLTILGMVSLGYHAGIAGSKRSRATWIVAISFGMVIALIASLDRPGGFIRVAQQPLIDLQEFIAADAITGK
ncbi:MAG TPA: hypothetical protein VFR30_03585 [Lysobacter sp.]|nr:hypothetical protein [Lysobacter sp.]